MSLRIRLSRGGAKKRPFYKIVIADSRYARDSRFIEKVGTYNPMLPKEYAQRVTLVEDRLKYWISQGAQPTDRVAGFLGNAGLIAAPAQGNNPEQAKPKAKAQERIRMAEEAVKKAEETARKAEEAAKAAAEAAKQAEIDAAAAAKAAAEAPVEAPAEVATEEPAAETASEAEAPAEETTA